MVARGGAVGWGTARVRLPIVSLEFFIDIGVDTVSKRNEYQEYFVRGKGGLRVGLIILPPSCAECHEIWEPQRPGTLKACPGL